MGGQRSARLGDNRLAEAFDGVKRMCKAVTGHPDLHPRHPHCRKLFQTREVGVGVESSSPGLPPSMLVNVTSIPESPVRGVESASQSSTPSARLLESIAAVRAVWASTAGAGNGHHRRRTWLPACALRRVAADPDRWVWLADRPRMGSDALGGEMPALIGEVVGRPYGADHLERFLEHCARSSKSTPRAANSRLR